MMLLLQSPSTLTRNVLIEAARLLATEAHAGVFRADGQPYITHPAAVVRWLAARGASPEVLATAWLHDTVEDTHLTLDDLLWFGFPVIVVDAVDAVTVRPGEDRTIAIHRAAAHPVGVQVKRSDNRHNSDPDQLTVFSPVVRSHKITKYAADRVILDASPYLPLAS